MQELYLVWKKGLDEVEFFHHTKVDVLGSAFAFGLRASVYRDL